MTTRHVALAGVAMLFFLSAGAATADRRATRSERHAVAEVVGMPAKCARVRISTETKRPKWASLVWKRRSGKRCEKFAADGVVVLKRKRGGKHWRFVTAGSVFSCGDLYSQVPRRVANDLGVGCEKRSM